MADFEDLRRRAEKKLDETISADSPEPSAPDLTRVIEELRIHQVELEIQNQDLREAQQQLEISREEYRVLYDSAPVGYFTLDPAGTILAANLTGAAQLGVERPALLNQNLTLYVAHADRDKFYLHLRRLMTSLAPQTSELRLISVDGSPFKVQLESTPAMDLNKGIPQIRTVMIDITARKKLEAALAQYRNGPAAPSCPDRQARRLVFRAFSGATRRRPMKNGRPPLCCAFSRSRNEVLRHGKTTN